VDAVTFSGDKLLGGPQAGIILGKKKKLDLFKNNPLNRALRIDKLTLAALESTLLLYIDEEKVMEEIPTLRMLSLDTRKLKRRGKRLLKKLSGLADNRIVFMVREDVSQVGGGALPLQELPTMVVAIKPLDFTVNHLEENLRKGEPPIISRISKEELILDMRTVVDEEIPLLAAGIEKALTQIAKNKKPSP
jgi:L-seryl-tRNA(Ser) seleniumtransferase